MTEPTSPLNAARPAAVPSMSKWQHTTNPLHIRRLGKTGEELAELAAVVSRCLIQGLDEIDPSSGKTNRQRLIDETADVRAQLNCNDRAFGLPLAEIAARVAKKEAWMAEWESHYGSALAQPSVEAPAPALRDWEITCDDCTGTGRVDHSEPLHVDGRYMGEDLFRIPCDTCLSTGVLVCVADIPKEIQR